MGVIGGLLGSALGRFVGGKFGKADAGQGVGKFVGGLLPFKKGGAVKRDTKALLHAGEYVLPKGVKPTKAQKAAVAKGKKSKK